MNSKMNRRQFLKKVGLAGATGFAIITNLSGTEVLGSSALENQRNNSNVCKFKPLCGNLPYHSLKNTDIREFPGDSCDLPEGHRYCQRYSENKMRLHRHTVLAVTDLIIGEYRGGKCQNQ